MSRIKIEHLGPIEYFENDVDEELMVFIGEQASGKSTIAKILFFCKSISEEFKKFLMNQENVLMQPLQVKNTVNFKKQLRTKFIEYFGTTKHMEPFAVTYTFDNGECMRIRWEMGYANVHFSRELEKKCTNLLRDVCEYYIQQEKSETSQDADLRLWISGRADFTKQIELRVDRIFEQTYTSIFVPAGRSMLATNSDFFHIITPNKYDILMNEFIERIIILQKQYSQKLDDIITDRKKTSSAEIDFFSVGKAKQLVVDILKGEYVNDKNGERIYYSPDRFVKLVQASSGQQEALWIVLMIFSVILNKQRVYLVIEEPEAHLFPNAQKKMLELIALMINATKSKVLLTTHSPYILTAANLAMYSSFVEGRRDSGENIVPPKYRINSGNVAAYMLKERAALDIMDRDNHMIKASKIDEISEILNSATDRLIEREIRNEL